MSRFQGLGFNMSANAEFCKQGLSAGSDHYHQACDACYNVATDVWADTTMNKAVQDNLRAMKMGDQLTMILASCMVAVAVARELDDIVLCRMMRCGFLPERSKLFQPNAWSWWQVPLFMLETIRHYCLLPLLTKAIPWLVLYRGGNALDICLNAIGTF